tara:strand:- start:555 stop:1094 length:540 start_codon:yes stop_codon:yes gene_type:complete
MAKRKKDIKVKNSDGITRVKPVRNVGTDEDGRKIQNIAIKRSDGSTTTTRYADGQEIGQTYQPKKMRKKRVKKLKVNKRLPRKLKTVKAPTYTSPEVTLDDDAKQQVAKKQEVKKKKEERDARIEARKKGKGKRKVRRIKRKVVDAVKTTTRKVKRKLTRGPKARKVKNLVSGGTNLLR